MQKLREYLYNSLFLSHLSPKSSFQTHYYLFKYHYLFVCAKGGITGLRRDETIDIELIIDYSNLDYSQVIVTMCVEKRS